MPYPRYNQQSASSSNRNVMMNPWDNGGGMLGNPVDLVNNLVGALMQQQTVVHQQPMMTERPRLSNIMRPRRSRSPGRKRNRTRSRSRSRSRRRRNSPRRRRSPPADRPDHEIYIGNYPANYTESQLRDLFSEFLIDVGRIRMKSDGHKVFAFAEVNSKDVVQKAVSNMDGKEHRGRTLRVRGSKEKGPRKAEEPKSSSHSVWIPKQEDCKLHLVQAFVQFIKRELEMKGVDESEDKRNLLDAAVVSLTTAFSLPTDESLNVSRNIEDIFFKAVRMELKPQRIVTPKAEEDPVYAASNNKELSEETALVPSKEAVDNSTVEPTEDECGTNNDDCGMADPGLGVEEQGDEDFRDLENCLAADDMTREVDDAEIEAEPEQMTASQRPNAPGRRGRRT